MFVIKRNGVRESMRYDKITDRNVELANGLNVDVAKLSQAVIQSLKNGMTTEEIDQLSAETAFFMSTYEPEFDTLSSRIAVSNLHKTTSNSFVEVMETLHAKQLIRTDLMEFVREHAYTLQQALDFSKDYDFNYFGFKTLERSYLLRVGKKIVERPQHMLMRVSVTIHGPHQGRPGYLDKVLDSYRLLSKGLFTHASPTLFNAGMEKGNLSSCFLIKMEDDLRHIYETNLRCGMISKYAGGIGIDISSVRAKGSIIKSTNGTSDGLVPMIQMFNASSRYANQCVDPDTLVLTEEGWIPIQYVAIGQRVLSHQGVFRKVTDIHMNQRKEEIYRISFKHTEKPLLITGDHEVLVVGSLSCQVDNQLITVNAGWKQVKDITIETDIGFIDLSGKKEVSIRTNEKGQLVFQADHSDFVRWFAGDKDLVPYDGLLYDLTVDVDETYHTEFGVIHNSGKRKGSFALYLQPFHPDILEFLGLRLNVPPEDLRARDIFLALWIPDIFMRRVEEDGPWSLICPSTEPRLCETYGEEFDRIYLECEQSGKARKTVKARDVWKAILHSQEETGMPYMLYKDSVNRKSMQKNLGIIRSSNLCVHGDTQLITKQGSKTIRELAELGQPTLIWNGFEWTQVQPTQTGIASSLLKISFSNGTEVMVTEYHNIPLLDGDIDEGKSGTRMVKAADATIGDTLTWWIDMIPSIDPKQPLTFTKRLQMDIRITGIEVVPGPHDTYCFTDEKRGLGVFNNILLGNCAEIVEVTDGESIASCNLSALVLHKFVEKVAAKPTINWSLMGQVVEQVVENLNRLIDITFYPVNEAKDNNMAYRPIALGVMGLSNVFFEFKTQWGSELSRWINRIISEVMYFHALTKSAELSQIEGPYKGFEGSPVSQGKLQYHLWAEDSGEIKDTCLPWTSKDHPMRSQIPDGLDVPILDWDALIETCKKGVRNSLLLANMPTASTASIRGAVECFEPITSNLYTRSVLAGDFTLVNQYLYRELSEHGLWNRDLVDKIIESDGSIATIDDIPDSIKQVYKTVWEIPQKTIIDFAAERGPFIDQTQSMNLFIQHPTHSKLSSMHLYAWKKGLKTGMYYLRSGVARKAVAFSVLKSNKKTEDTTQPSKRKIVCTDDICTSCQV